MVKACFLNLNVGNTAEFYKGNQFDSLSCIITDFSHLCNHMYVLTCAIILFNFDSNWPMLTERDVHREERNSKKEEGIFKADQVAVSCLLR